MSKNRRDIEAEKPGGDRGASSGKTNGKGSVPAMEAAANPQGSNLIEKSLDDFIARANARLSDTDGWDLGIEESSRSGERNVIQAGRQRDRARDAQPATGDSAKLDTAKPLPATKARPRWTWAATGFVTGGALVAVLGLATGWGTSSASSSAGQRCPEAIHATKSLPAPAATGLAGEAGSGTATTGGTVTGTPAVPPVAPLPGETARPNNDDGAVSTPPSQTAGGTPAIQASAMPATEGNASSTAAAPKNPTAATTAATATATAAGAAAPATAVPPANDTGSRG
ncbi:MAG: hypothetical protein V2A73_19550, partial [Pseudomonadota bacterium]